MKKQIIALALLGLSSFVFAHPTAAQLKSDIYQNILAAATVQISAQFNLDSSLMFWASDSVRKNCQGVLIEGDRMAAPLSCFQKTGYQLNSLYYTLSNGKQIVDDPKSLHVKGDMVYVPLANSESMIKTLPRLPVHYVTSKNEVASSFRALLSTNHVRHLRHGRNRSSQTSRSTLRVGSALIHEGKLVALVKEHICSYRGDLPFEILAFF